MTKGKRNHKKQSSNPGNNAPAQPNQALEPAKKTRRPRRRNNHAHHSQQQNGQPPLSRRQRKLRAREVRLAQNQEMGEPLGKPIEEEKRSMEQRELPKWVQGLKQVKPVDDNAMRTTSVPRSTPEGAASVPESSATGPSEPLLFHLLKPVAEMGPFVSFVVPFNASEEDLDKVRRMLSVIFGPDWLSVMRGNQG
ncbi:hypothetical protein N0V90_005479 [Kalmusia sp. IMI 367209]|nr:hypothetical protein N0V90_005479 [Kalmusia sp. IMI 367209]